MTNININKQGVININTGDVIKILRKNFDMTQDELATLLNVNKSSVQKYESGAVSNLKRDTIRTLCTHFKIPPWVLIFPELVENEEVINKMQYENHLLENVEFLLTLNDDGKEKVLEYAQDLIDSDNYTE